MRKRALFRVVLMGWLLLGNGLPPVAPVRASDGPRAIPSGVLRDFAARLRPVEEQLPALIAAAEVCAEKTVANPELLIDVPYAPQPGFAEEMVNRSGGLANALPSEENPHLATADDILLFAVRSWEEDGRQAVTLLRQRRARGQWILLFASRAGAPEGVEADAWFDNGASRGGADEAGVNAIVNAMNGMLWCVEYVAALSRRGKYPGILQGILEAGAAAHNERLGDRAGRRRLYDADAALPAGQGGQAYLAAVRELVDAINDGPGREQIENAAGWIGGHMSGGGKVGLTTCTHLLMSEISRDTRAPWIPFNCVWKTHQGVFRNHVGAGDLVMFFGYVGVSTSLEDYASAMRQAGAAMVVSCAADKVNPDNMVPEAIARIDQRWSLPDAIIPLPFPPGHMAALSGVESGLRFRMLDEAVAARLPRAEPEAGP